ncbi:MAG: hypothetical protein LBU64_14130 [Planctomycetota bacterium]|nr:hypothetical protein [Planctomycetota bacterium]
MQDYRAGFLPLARVNFDMEAAAACLAESKAMLNRVAPEIICPDKHLTGYDEMIAWIGANGPFDFVVAQASTFMDPRFGLEYLRLLDCPTVIWGVREPSIAAGTRIRLNSLTGAIALTQISRQLGRDFEFVYGNPGEEAVETAVARWAKAAAAAARIRDMRLGVIGSIPPGYFFSLEEEVQLRSRLGPQVFPIEMYKLFHRMESVGEAARRAEFEKAAAKVPALREMPGDKQLVMGGFCKVVRDFIDQNRLTALCGRCWPDSFERLGIAFCGIYGLFGAELPVGCEADMGGTVSIAMLSWLSGGPAYLADPVSLDEKADAMTFWHCGYGAPALANPREPIKVVGHPNRKLPPSFEFSLKPGRVTICRLGKGAAGRYRLLVAAGDCRDAPVQFSGTSAVVTMDGGAKRFLDRLANQGWEYHIALGYGDLREELATLGRLLGVEVVRVW